MTLSLAALATAPKIKMHWGNIDNIYAGGTFGLPANGPWASGSTYLPFDAHSTPEGESPTSYAFYGKTVEALASPCVLTKFEVGGALNNARSQLYDLLWVSTNYTAAGAQTINSNPLPSRDAVGSTNGVGCGLAVFAGGNAVIDVTYTNSDGVSGRTINAVDISLQTGPLWLPLASGDSGVKSVQSVTSDSATPYRLAIIRKLATARQPSGGGTGAYWSTPDKNSGLSTLTEIPAGALLWAAWSNAGGIGIRQFSTDIELAVV